MKILLIGNFGTGWDGSICDEEHIASALEELGHAVTRIPREEFQGVAPKGEYDFTLIAQWDGYPTVIYAPTPIVYWAFDYQADGQEWHERLVKQADLYLSKRIADSKYPNWQWLSQDFAPKFLDKATVPVEKDIDVLFTGSYLPWATERNEIIDLVAKNYNLVIHSVNEWPQGNREPLMDDKLPELYARAKIILSVDHTLEAGYWSDRNAQIMACGGFTLFRYVPLSESIFHSNVAYFFGKQDVLPAIEYWLERDEDREMVAGEGYDNSWQYKVKERTQDMLNAVRNIL